MAGRSIGYDVPLIPQTTSMGCWAAGMAMILAWKNGICVSPVTIASNPGAAPYLSQLQTGLDPNDVNILRRWGFVVEAPECYAAEGLARLLEAHGPLWVAAKLPTIPAHIRVITGMDVGGGSRVYVNDPWEQGMMNFHWPQRGSRYSRTFGRFMAQVEGLGRDELSEPSPIYVAHLP